MKDKYHKYKKQDVKNKEGKKGEELRKKKILLLSLGVVLIIILMWKTILMIFAIIGMITAGWFFWKYYQKNPQILKNIKI